ncbi:MAG: pilus assembly protein PilM, partial [Patescibacteria group bacterium]
AICRSLLLKERPKFKGENKNYIILDIGATRTGLTVYSKNTILFTISIPISGNEITNKIAESLKIDQTQAEKAKVICGLDEDKAQGVVKDILSDVIDGLTSKINEAVDFYNSHFPNRGPINQIMLCGGGANIKKLNRIINEKLNINTVVGDPLVNLDGAKDDFSKILHSIKHLETVKKYQAKDKPSSLNNDFKTTFSTAIGLSLRSLFLEE